MKRIFSIFFLFAFLLTFLGCASYPKRDVPEHHPGHPGHEYHY